MVQREAIRRRRKRSRERFRALKELEDFGVTNHMASFVMLKRGWLHLLRVRYTLFFFELLYRTIFTDVTPGRLRGLQTIHFAHWTVIDRPRSATDSRRGVTRCCS